MATRKYTVTLPEELAEEIRAEVGPGAFSAYVTRAVERRREHDRLGELLAWMQEEQGSLTEGEHIAAAAELRNIERWFEEREADARDGRADGRLMKDICFILDSEALSRVVLRDRALMGVLTKAHRAGVRVRTSPVAVVEAYRSEIRLPEWSWAVARVVVEPVTRPIADEAILLLRETGLHGHKYAMDAILAAIANRQRGPAVVFTSDADDLTKLCAPRVQVRAL